MRRKADQLGRARQAAHGKAEDLRRDLQALRKAGKLDPSAGTRDLTKAVRSRLHRGGDS